MTTSAVTPRAQSIALWILAAVALIFFLRAASQLLIPIVIAVLISYALEPVVAWLATHGVPRVAGTSAILLGLLALTGWGVYSLRDDVQEAIDSLPEAARRAREMVMSQSGEGPSSSIQEAAGILQGARAAGAGESTETDRTTGTGTQQPSGSSDSGGGSRGNDAHAEGVPAASSPQREGEAQNGGASSATDFIQRGVGSIVALAGHLTVIFFLVFFLLLSGHHFRDRLVEISGPDRGRKQTTAAIVDDINEQIQRFLLVRLATAVFVGALTWAVLAWMGVQHAAVWGILAGVFNSIPYFGPVIVSGGLLVVGLVQGGGLTQALQMSGAALVITSVEGWLLEPPLMGKAERMSAIAVFLGLLLWSWIWGAWGTVLAVPMLVVLKSIADHVQPLRPIGRLLAP